MKTSYCISNLFRSDHNRRARHLRFTLTALTACAVWVGTMLCGTSAALGQLSVSLQQPPPNQLKVADLWRVTIVNPTRQTFTVYLQGTAKEATVGQVVDAQTGQFQIPPGTKVVTGRDVGAIKVNSSNSRYKNILLQTGTVPAGDYTVCVTVHNSQGGDELANDCIDQHVANATLVLITPADEATVEEDMPIFIWTATPPLDSRASYGLKIVEVLGNQTPYAAMQANSALFQQADIHTSTLQYPISGAKFALGRNYAWQITAYEDGATLSQSEVWGFTFKTPDSIVPYKKVVKNAALSQFEKVYGGSGFDHGLAIEQTKDSGYIIAGYTHSFGSGNDDGYLIKTDAAGTVQWSRTYGGENDDAFSAVRQCPDGGYVAVGFTRSFDVGNDDIYIVKTDPTGDPEWSKVFGGGGYDAGYAVEPTPDGGYVIAGAIGKGDAYLGNEFDGFVVKLDKGGNAQWASDLGAYDCDILHAIHFSSPYYIAAGYTRSFGVGNDDMYYLLLNREGGLARAVTFGCGASDRAYAIAPMNEAAFAVVGYTSPFGDVMGGGCESTTDGDVHVIVDQYSSSAPHAIRLNAGHIERGLAADVTKDRGVVVTGYLVGDSTHHTSGLLAFKLIGDGMVDWSRIYDGSAADQGYGITSTFDGGVAIAGWSDRGSGEGDALVIKTDKKGVVGCTDHDAGLKAQPSRPSPEMATALLARGLNIRNVSTASAKAATVEQLLCPK